MKPRTALHALTLLLLACDRDEPPAEPTIAELAACDEADLQLSPFMGPAFDQNSVLVAPLPQPYLVATTVGWHNLKDREALEGETTPVVMDVFNHEGLLGAAFAWSDDCGSARTITLWRDDAARMKFVFGEAHGAAIQRGLKYTRGWETTNWSETAAEPPSWDTVRARLAEVRQQ
jgi:hypothetical protein